MDKLKKSLLLLLVGLVMVSTLAAGYFYFKYQETQKDQSKEEIAEILQELSRLIILPTEEPSFATVVDKEILKDQDFFQSAENGDKVIIYPLTGKAILYRPAVKKIVDVVPVKTVDNLIPEEPDTADSRISPTPLPLKPQVTLYNGTSVPGLSNTIRDMILASTSEVEITQQQTAGNLQYLDTIVVDLTGTNQTAVELLAGILAAEISGLPETEVLPESDILVIIGADLID